MEKLLLLIISIVFLICLFFYSANILLAPSSGEGLEPEVCLKNNCFSVEVAKTAKALTQGLMGRKSLDKDKGMIFIFEEEGIYPFWMKKTEKNGLQFQNLLLAEEFSIMVINMTINRKNLVNP